MVSESTKLSSVLVTIIIIISAGILALEFQPVVTGDWDLEDYELKTFDSYQEFTEYLQTSFIFSSKSYSSYSLESDFMGRSTAEESVMSVPSSSNGDEGGSLVDYSQTNIQVEGVDEPDIVKSDGTYLYIVSNNKVFIVKAYPASDAAIEGELTFNSTLSIHTIFIDGTRLVVFATSYDEPILYKGAEGEDTIGGVSRWYSSPDTSVFVYDLTDMSNPTVQREIVVAGSLNGARLIDDYVYVVATQYTYSYYLEDVDEIVPRVLVNGEVESIGLDHIHYVDIPEKSSTMTNVVSFHVHNDDEAVTTESYLLGNTQTLYVSQQNIYVAYTVNSYDYDYLQSAIDEVLKPYLSETLSEELELVDQLSLTDYQKQTVTEWILQNQAQEIPKQHQETIAREILQRVERTIIHRIHIDNGVITYESQGDIPGYVSDQFSFSEYENHLRVSSTLQGWSLRSYLGSIESQNNVYVLNMNLDVVGYIEGLAPGETIYATRFIGDRCYLVTFKRIDPFFVIDLQDPTNPVVLGELKIPGYSSYLHPYDDNHIIGIGKEDASVKISLFDVTDVTNPVEVAKNTVDVSTDEGYQWSDSSALYDHKAFLFDREKNLLVLPIGTWSTQSAYVFDITLDDIALKGTVTHTLEESETSEKPEYDYYYSYDYGNSIQRCLYIEDVLYTVSTNMVKMNELTTLEELNSVTLAS